MPKLSIAIPTKNRYDTLLPLLTCLLSVFDGKDIEFVVQDNSDDNSRIADDNILSSPQIKYFYKKESISVVDNCDSAVSHCSGTYVTMIGDDDCVAKEILDVVDIMIKHDIESCGCDYSLYRWLLSSEGQNYFEYDSKKKIVKHINVGKELTRQLKRGIQNKDYLPCVYHGILLKRKLDELKALTGTYFPGPSPDMANCVALSCLVNKHIHISLPVIIDGYSKSSTGHLTEKKEHKGSLKDKAFLPKDTIEKWNPKIPQLWLPGTIWAQSATCALKALNSDYISKLNYCSIYLKMAILYPFYKSTATEYLKKYCNFFQVIYNCFKIAAIVFTKKLFGKKRRMAIKEKCSLMDAVNYNSSIFNENDGLGKLEKKIRLLF